MSRAQVNQTYDGGTGIWDAGTTPDWNGTNTWTNGNNAIFSGTANTVTVSGAVGVNEMIFGASGATTISGGTLNETPHSPAMGDPTLIQVNAGSGPVTISSQIELSDLGGNQQSFVTNNSNSNLTLGNIDFGPYTLNPSATANRRVNLNANTAGSIITLNGTYTDSVANHLGQFNITTNAGAINVSSSANFANYLSGTLNNYAGGTENISNSTFLSTFSFSEQNANGGANLINLVGAQTIKAGLYDSMKNSGTRGADGVSAYGYAHVNQSTANVSTWSGNVTMDGTNLNLSAVTGGRLNMTGTLNSNTPLGLIVSGNGTVVLGSPSGDNFNEQDGNGYLLTLNPVAADLQSGTTLITNTPGGTSAFGQGKTTGKQPGNPAVNITSNLAIVKLEGGATLGGTGSSAPQIVSEDKSSIITAGDPGQASLGIAASIGTLNLINGLVVNSTTTNPGLTMDFKLNGDNSNPGFNNDLISAYSLNLTGTITVNFTKLGTLATGENYELIQGGGGNWSDTGATFDFNAPAGYVVDSYDFDPGGNFTVEFALAPEPSTYALMGLGLLALAAVCWTRRVTRYRIEDRKIEQN